MGYVCKSNGRCERSETAIEQPWEERARTSYGQPDASKQEREAQGDLNPSFKNSIL